MKITNAAVIDSYNFAKKIKNGKIKQSKAIEKICEEHGMKSSSITGYVRNFFHMVNGERYRRTMNLFATEYYLQNIYKDYGYNKLQNALSALAQHIDYYEGIRTINRKGFRDLLIKFGQINDPDSQSYPEEVTNLYEIHIEGALKKVFVNRFERNKKARQKCIDHYKPICSVCYFDFEKIYKKIGQSFIHVHHLKELSSIAENYVVDPINDLRPVCPNCHAMLHKRKPAYSIDELKDIINL